MTFTFSAGGTPDTAKAAIEKQALAVRENNPAPVGKAASIAAKAVRKYLGSLDPTSSVSVSVSFGITHSTPAAKESATSNEPATTA